MEIKFILIWLVVSTHLKNISQNGNLPQIGVKIKHIWNHHPVIVSFSIVVFGLTDWPWDPFVVTSQSHNLPTNLMCFVSKKNWTCERYLTSNTSQTRNKNTWFVDPLPVESFNHFQGYIFDFTKVHRWETYGVFTSIVLMFLYSKSTNCPTPEFTIQVPTSHHLHYIHLYTVLPN